MSTSVHTLNVAHSTTPIPTSTPSPPKGHIDLTTGVTPEMWIRARGREEGYGFVFGENEKQALEHWQASGEWPPGQPSRLSPRFSTYNVLLTFIPEENTLYIEFFYLGRTVSLKQQPGDEWEDLADVPMSAVSTRRARKVMLKWEYSLECPPEAWRRLLNLYFRKLNRIVNSFEVLRQEVMDVENIDE
jgi:hypothetical protein